MICAPAELIGQYGPLSIVKARLPMAELGLPAILPMPQALRRRVGKRRA